MSRPQAILIPTSAGTLAAVVHLPDELPAPAIVCCHGLLSSKDSTKYVSIGEEFSRGGFALLRFDFSGCGGSKAAPGEDLLSTRTRDLRGVMDYVREQPWASNARMGLLGSSLGGYVALLTAASSEDEVGAVACWATPFDLDKVEQALDKADGLGSLVSAGFKTGAPRDLAGLLPVPSTLIIHGQEDEIVSWKESVQLYHQVGEPKRLLLMKTADHRFLDPDCRELAIRTSLDWFRERNSSFFSNQRG